MKLQEFYIDKIIDNTGGGGKDEFIDHVRNYGSLVKNKNSKLRK